LIMGVTGYNSYKMYEGSLLKKVARSCWKIGRPYLVATILYSLVFDGGLNADSLLYRVFHFNASGPFYYVLLYIQLLLCEPLIYCFIEWTNRIKFGVSVKFLGMIVLLAVSSWTTNYTNILNVYGGGGRLFGGTYLVLLYVGMLVGKNYSKISIRKEILWVIYIIIVLITVLWWNFISINNCKIDSYLPYGNGTNPPSISFGLYACLMACCIFLSELTINTIPKNELLKRLFFLTSILGKHTLYIFLYHKLFLDYFIPLAYKKMGAFASDIWIMRVVYFLSMIIGSLLFEKVLEGIHFALKMEFRKVVGIKN